jgi:hypothetical protein
MKKTVFGFAAAAVISLASFSAPAMAFTTNGPLASPASPITAARTVVVHHSKVCSVRTIVKRGPHGRRSVTKVRTCR